MILAYALFGVAVVWICVNLARAVSDLRDYFSGK